MTYVELTGIFKQPKRPDQMNDVELIVALKEQIERLLKRGDWVAVNLNHLDTDAWGFCTALARLLVSLDDKATKQDLKQQIESLLDNGSVLVQRLGYICEQNPMFRTGIEACSDWMFEYYRAKHLISEMELLK